MTSHKHDSLKTEVHRCLTNAAECQYEFVQVFYDNKWISSGTFEFEKTTTSNPKKSIQVPKKLGMLNVIKQLQHFILCNMMCLWSTEKKY
jgi:hypothetical protein